MEEQHDTMQVLLQKGIDAVKAKDKNLARSLLEQASALDPDNIVVWFWLSAAHENPYKQEVCLLKVLALDPENALAARGLGITQQRIIDDAFQLGVTAAQNNNPESARSYFTEVVERDQNNIKAWEWLSQVAETSEDQEICFSNILSLDPGNDAVQDKLTLLRQTRAMADQNPWEMEMGSIENADETAMNAPTLAGDILGKEYIEKHTMVIPEPEEVTELPSIALWARYHDPLLCPYCASPTKEKQKRCPACKKPLWISNLSTESRSTLLWFVIILQAFSTIMLAVVPLVILFIVAQRLNIFNFFTLLPAYLGRPSSLNPNIISAAFDIVSRRWFFLSWVPALLTLIFAITLSLRWVPVYYLMLLSAVLGLAGSIALLAGKPAFEGSLFAGALGAVLSLSTLIMVMKLENDFRRTRHRIYLNVDSDLNDGMTFLLLGKQYARKGLWALASIHFRRAIALMPYDAGSYLATAVACSQLHDYKLARNILEDAQRMDPENTRIREALKILATAQTDDITTNESIQADQSDGAGADDTPELDKDVERDDSMVNWELVGTVSVTEQGNLAEKSDFDASEYVDSQGDDAAQASWADQDDITGQSEVVERNIITNPESDPINDEPDIDFLANLFSDDEYADNSPQLPESDNSSITFDTKDQPSRPANNDDPGS